MTLDIATVLRGTGADVLRVGGASSYARTAQAPHAPAAAELAPGDLSPGDLQRAILDVCIDSRAVTPGALFFALPGEHVDGHEYVGEALRCGALGCVVSHVPDLSSLHPAAEQTAGSEPRAPRFLFLAPDSLEALQRLAAYWRRQHDPTVIGITGSVGKTTTKEVVAAILSSAVPVLKSEANLNTEIGLPLMLLRLRPHHRAAVLEMGMYLGGDIALLAKIARPHLGIVTNVAPVHLERMGTIERIAREKSSLVAALPSEGLAILNGDDPWTRAMAETSGIARVILAGTSPDCDYRALDLATHGLSGVSFTLLAEGRRMQLRTRVPGGHTVFAFLAAAAAARALGLDWDVIQEAIDQITVLGRQQVLPGPDRALIIDDSYNAAPMSMHAALDLLQASSGAKIAVLGDMLELGAQQEEAAHRQIGERVAEVADWLVVRGHRSDWLAQAAQRHGLPGSRVVRAAGNEEAVLAVRAILSHGAPPSASDDTPTMQRAKLQEQESGSPVRWTILVKGSRGMRMEEVVHGLRGER